MIGDKYVGILSNKFCLIFETLYVEVHSLNQILISREMEQAFALTRLSAHW
jgi:hypothetical protein